MSWMLWGGLDVHPDPWCGFGAVLGLRHRAVLLRCYFYASKAGHTEVLFTLAEVTLLA